MARSRISKKSHIVDNFKVDVHVVWFCVEVLLWVACNMVNIYISCVSATRRPHQGYSVSRNAWKSDLLIPSSLKGCSSSDPSTTVFSVFERENMVAKSSLRSNDARGTLNNVFST